MLNGEISTGVTTVVFGDRSHLLGRWHYPATGVTTAAVVMCNPVGYEYMSAFRGFRLLAEMLAERGFAVLRFDYEGTGDSGGDSVEQGQVAGWSSSIGAAIDFVQQAGCKDVVLFGVRLGATLALLQALEHRDVQGLVLWSLIPDGRRYEREIRTLAKMSKRILTPQEGAEGLNASGFRLSEGTLAELKTLDIAEHLKRPLPRTLILDDPRRAIPQSIVEDLRSHATELTVIASFGTSDWIHAHPTLSVVPIQPEFNAVCNWMTSRWTNEGTSIGLRPASTAPLMLLTGVDGVVERPLMLGEDEVFAIETAPAKVARSSTGLVLINSGRDHHVGPGREWVNLSRRLATSGMRTLRIDVSGVGDSPHRPDKPDNVVYSEGAMLDISLAVDHLRREGSSQVVLMSLCSGAYLAVEFAASHPIEGVVAINPQFYFDGIEVDPEQYALNNSARKSAVRRMASRLIRILRIRQAAAALLDYIRPTATSITWLDAMADNATPFLLIYGEGNAGLVHLRKSGSSALQKLVTSPNFQLELVPGLDHGMLDVDARTIAIGYASDWILKRFSLDSQQHDADRRHNLEERQPAQTKTRTKDE